MSTGYPNAIDNFTDPTAANNLNDAPVLHHTLHTNINDAINAIETELGITPKGSSGSVAARLSAMQTSIDGKLAASSFHAAFGVATLDGSSKLVEEVDASKMTSGILATARIPNISGGKILGTGSGGAAIPVDAVPNLDTAKITSGSFNVARIPNLDAAKITSGVFDKARIPTDFGATAIVKADIASRDLIPLANRVDGMLVYVRQPWALYMWRADSSTWQAVSLRVALTAAQSVLASAAWSNVTNMSFPVMAGVTYGIDVVAFLTSPSSTPDIKFGWTFPAGTMHAGMNGPDTGSTSSSSSGWSAHAILADTTSPLDETTGIGLVAGQQTLATLRATFVCTANGTVQLRFAQNTSDATNLPSIQPGSRMRVESY